MSSNIKKPASKMGWGNHNEFRNWQINQRIYDQRGVWKNLTREQLNIVERIGKTLLIELGYL